MGDFFFKPKRVKHLCCPPPIEKMDINSPLLVYKFPCKIKLAMKVNSSVGSSNHNQCYTVANEKLNAYGKWAGCPGGSGPGYSSTMRYFPNDNGSGLGPTISGAICNCAYIDPTLSPSSLPVNTMAPAISGITLFGSTLRTTNGKWTGVPAPTFKYEWLREGALIPNQTNVEYVTQLADIGQQITCRVTGTNSADSAIAISNVMIVTSLPVNNTAPEISGKTLFGSTLTTTNGTWTVFPAPTFTYQWLREDALIPNQTKNTYVTQLADIGQQITCRVTGTNSADSAIAISNVMIVTSLPVNNTAPEISGKTLFGSTLTTTNGTWTGVPAPTFMYQWYSGTTPLSGQTKNTYVTQLADIGQPIKCSVTGTNSAGSAIAISDVMIVASLPVNNAAPEISGDPLLGSTLTTTNGTWTGVPAPTFTYEWLRTGALITNQTNDKYVTQLADIGQHITCRVTGTNSAGSAIAISSVITPIEYKTFSVDFTLSATTSSFGSGGFLIYKEEQELEVFGRGKFGQFFDYLKVGDRLMIPQYPQYLIVRSKTYHNLYQSQLYFAYTITGIDYYGEATDIFGISSVTVYRSIPPVNISSSLPVISGDTLVGSTLTTTNGTWTGVPAPTFKYEWYSGTTPLSGQTKNTYVTQLADIGQQITCRVTGTNSADSAIAISNVITVTSLPVNTMAPAISGNRSSGATLTTTNGTWTGFPAPTFTYEWLREGAPITTQTNDKYVTQVSDIGYQITCRVTGTNSAGSASAISNVIIVAVSSPQNITFSSTSSAVIFETIYINSLNAVVTSPVLNGFTIYRVTSTPSTASYVINSNSLSVTISFLIIGGGGSGASTGGAAIESGGGGGGGFIESSGTTNSNTAYSIYVGKGGFLSNSTANGENSLLQLISGTLTAVGGGGGGNLNTNLNGLNGGSGGGGAFNYNNGNFGRGGNGTLGQGFSGASGTVEGPLAGSGGSGGGAGGNGISNSLNGGPGLPSSITGQSIYYAGGGGGVSRSGGIGGGGGWGNSGTNGLGGGGGGSSGTGTSGGSGVVILRIPSFI